MGAHVLPSACARTPWAQDDPPRSGNDNGEALPRNLRNWAVRRHAWGLGESADLAEVLELSSWFAFQLLLSVLRGRPAILV